MTVQRTTLIEAVEAERYVKSPGSRPDWFVVVAYNALGSYWSIRSGTFHNAKEAHIFAETKLSSAWTHARIVKIPGEADADALPLVRDEEKK